MSNNNIFIYHKCLYDKRVKCNKMVYDEISQTQWVLSSLFCQYCKYRKKYNGTMSDELISSILSDMAMSIGIDLNESYLANDNILYNVKDFYDRYCYIKLSEHYSDNYLSLYEEKK